jgi:pimeloyl-ACP methyl ester carboxylesterase
MVAYPDLVDHVILSGTATRLSRWLIQIQRLNEPIMRMMTPIQLAKMVTKQFGIPSQYLADFTADFGSFSVDSFSAIMRSYGDISMPSSTKSPTLICVGSKETGIAKSMARQLENGIPNSRRIVIPEGSHVWNMQFPDLFCSITRTWIESESLPAEVVFG